MKLKIYSVFDSKAEAFFPPFLLHNDSLAVRTFRDALNDDGHQFHKNPGDYTLFYFGEFDDSDGSFEVVNARSLGNGLSFVRRADHQAEGV